MQNRHPLENKLCQLLKDEEMDKAERAIQLKKILSFFNISNDYYDEQVAKYYETLATHGYELFDLNALKRADINAEGDYPLAYINTALTHAIYNKDEESAYALLNANANPNTSCAKFPQSPLFLATVLNLKACVSYLLEKKADVNVKNKNIGTTALHSAAVNGHVEIATILLAHGADHTAMNNRGFTALDFAVYSASLPIVKLLLEKGAAIKHPLAMQKFLMSQDQTDEAVKYCYTKLTQYSISSTPSTLTQDKHLTLSDIISRIQLKIDESRSNDKGFSSLFRDVNFSTKQIKIAEELINRLNRIDTQLPLDQLKTKIASEFETALNAFTLLLAEKNNISRVNTKAFDPNAASMTGTRFHSTILALTKEISSSVITQDSHIAQDNETGGDGITLFELKTIAPR